MTNLLYYGDNLDILREQIGNESVDLIYLDPPFNSNASYNVLFGSEAGGGGSRAQIEAFDDTWHWTSEAEAALDQVTRSGNTQATNLLLALRSSLGDTDLMAYLTMMAVRLLELRRVLKPSGSLYLHCDPTASHHLKLLLDAVFRPQNFLSEVIWKRTGTHSSARRWGPVHDVILAYAAASGSHKWNRPYVPPSDKHLASHYRKKDENGRRYEYGELTGPGVRNGRSGATWLGFDVTSIGRHWTTTVEKLEELYESGRIYLPADGGWPRLIRYEDESKGRALGDVWDDIPPLNMRAAERLGYPTQKPAALLERIIAASSDAGDVVLDPFCGCGTTIYAAQKLDRRWIGIDVTHLAISLIERRLKEAFGDIPFRVHGTPKDLAGARDLAHRDKYQFQWWALSLIDAQPYGGKKKGADSGIDGLIYFRSDARTTERAIVSVKGGDNVGVPMVRDLKGVLEREKAPIGVFLTLAQPTRPMEAEAAAAGFYTLGERRYPRLQIITVEQALNGAKPAIPLVDAGAAFKRARRETPGTQSTLF